MDVISDLSAEWVDGMGILIGGIKCGSVWLL